MEQYHIYHSTDINKFEEIEKQPREYAGLVQANNTGAWHTPTKAYLEAIKYCLTKLI